GHAKSVLDILLEDESCEIAGCVGTSKNPGECLEGLESVRVLGDDSILPEIFKSGVKYVFVAVGDNRVRSKLYNKVIQLGFMPISAISKKAIVSDSAMIGEGTCIMPGAVINVNAKIGKGCIINTNSSIDHDCMIEDFVHIAPGVAVSGYTSIGEGTFIGTNSSVIDKIHIGRWTQVGAGAAVVNDLPSNILAYGVPAKEIRRMEK
ncbi:MAG: acetyltransferase, partial [Lachnospiraceae bacterium]|nr:acetyltransferase [Lachnospiraceae bacterium]